MYINIYGHQLRQSDFLLLKENDTTQSFEKRLIHRKWRADAVNSILSYQSSIEITIKFISLSISACITILYLNRILPKYIELTQFITSHIPPSQERRLIEFGFSAGFIWFTGLYIMCTTFFSTYYQQLFQMISAFRDEKKYFIQIYTTNFTKISNLAQNPTSNWLTTESKKLFGIALAAAYSNQQRGNEPEPTFTKLVHNRLYEPCTMGIVGQFL